MYVRQDRKQKDKPAAALALCFCLMALVSVFAVKSNIDKVNDNMADTESSQVLKEKSVENAEDVAEKTETSTEIVDSREDGSQENHTNDAGYDEGADTDENGSSAGSASEYIMPVEGEIIMEYSTDMPIYWQTLDQYMTHSGIDIASAAGAPVQACAAGTVTKIEENGKMGITVEINHGNDLISVYSNLASDGLVELGEVVKKGAVIGKVGQSAMLEFESPDHLHFEMRLGENPVNPGDYFTTLT